MKCVVKFITDRINGRNGYKPLLVFDKESIFIAMDIFWALNVLSSYTGSVNFWTLFVMDPALKPYVNATLIKKTPIFKMSLLSATPTELN